MDYKEEYQKALERAKKGLPLDEVFPELKESEDERIRKEIIHYLEHIAGGLSTEEQRKWIAYLEKQKYEYEVFEPVESTLEYKMGFKAGVESVKQKEQTPAECWRPSIEQMAMLRAVINDKHNMASASANLALNSLYDDLIKL